MGRVLRRRKRSDDENSENTTSKPIVQKSILKVTDNKSHKKVLNDRTNLNVKNSVEAKSIKDVKLCDPHDNSNLKVAKNRGIFPKTTFKNALPKNNKNTVKLATTSVNSIQCISPSAESQHLKTKVKPRDIKCSQALEKSFLGFTEEEVAAREKQLSTEGHFCGFEKAEKSFRFDDLKKVLETSTLSTGTSNSNTKIHLPVYRIIKQSPPKMVSNVEDRLHLYDFEIDENEPVVKKGKRKPILKIKRHRTYNKKKKLLHTVGPLNRSNQENVCPNIQPPPQKGYTPLSPIADRNCSEPLEKSIASELDTSIESRTSNRDHILYSPPPYKSPRRDSSPNVPVLRTSLSENHDIKCNKSLNESANCSRQNLTLNSPYSQNFNSPMYLGCSTPIHRHWTEHSNYIDSNITSQDIKNFDISNNFGFDDGDIVEEPIVSPIKRYETPIKPATPRKPSPVKIPHRQVIRMLKLDSEESLNTSKEDESLPMEELLPSDFFHAGDTPTFSLSSSPVTPPMLRKKANKTNHGGKKKQVAFVVKNLDDSDFGTQSSEDRTSHEDDISKNDQTLSRTAKNNHRLCRTTRNNQTLNKTVTSNQSQRKTRRNANKDDSDTEKDKGYETENSPTKHNNSTFITRQPRRSYERPEYLRPKKYGKNLKDEEDFEEEETEPKAKPQESKPRKKNALSKKEENELEQWAKAFNEQCMQVESFNLVVE